MAAWWNDLSLLNQIFWGGAVFFSVLFGWQLIASIIGLGGAGDADLDAGTGGMDVDMGGDVDLSHVDLHMDIHGDIQGDIHGDAGTADGNLVEDSGGLATFRLLSVRSVLAFGTLFSWAGALYLQDNASIANSLLIALAWGLAGMLIVAGFFWLLPKLTEEGNLKLSSTIGKTATVYIRIPAEGTGQVRVLADDRLSYLRARSAEGSELVAGQEVIVRSVSSDGVLSVSLAGDIEANKGVQNGR